jgi:hypothetical protein
MSLINVSELDNMRLSPVFYLHHDEAHPHRSVVKEMRRFRILLVEPFPFLGCAGGRQLRQPVLPPTLMHLLYGNGFLCPRGSYNHISQSMVQR